MANGGLQTARVPEESSRTGKSSRTEESSCTEAKTLLGALRNVIIPLVRRVNGEHKHDTSQNALGPDGEQFVNALKQFMASFLQSQRGPVGSIEVELEENGADMDIQNAASLETAHDAPSSQYGADAVSATAASPNRFAPTENTGQEDRGSNTVHNEGSTLDIPMVSTGGTISILHTDGFAQRKSHLIDKALNALRAHVFNAMPIRLLCFQPVRSKLQVTLIERGEIYARIASTLVHSIDFLRVFKEIADMACALKVGRSRETLHSRAIGSAPEKAEQIVLAALIGKCASYAILSHTWLRGAAREITYSDWLQGDADPHQPGYRKLVSFCRTAWIDNGITLGWMDTVCINKESSTELDESIRSMYKWYSNAAVCTTYLAETVTLSDMPQDTWFTRGWTLQELLAPRCIKFYNTHWDKIIKSSKSDKDDSNIWQKIEQATTIRAAELRRHIFYIPISRRMQMAATRQVTREEDSAYSLMGILDVSIATAYGEGAERAFARLLQAVLNASGFRIADMFNWAGARHSRLSSLLPSSLEGYLHRASSLDIEVMPIEPIMPTHLGLRVTIVLMPAISIRHSRSQLPYRSFGDYHAIADVAVDPEFRNSSRAQQPARGPYSVLDARISVGNVLDEEASSIRITLGVLNVTNGEDERIMVPKYCLAVGLQFIHGSPQRVGTKAPIAFTLSERSNPTENGIYYYYIQRSKLKTHGMKLVTMVL